MLAACRQCSGSSLRAGRATPSSFSRCHGALSRVASQGRERMLAACRPGDAVVVLLVPWCPEQSGKPREGDDARCVQTVHWELAACKQCTGGRPGDAVGAMVPCVGRSRLCLSSEAHIHHINWGQLIVIYSSELLLVTSIWGRRR